MFKICLLSLLCLSGMSSKAQSQSATATLGVRALVAAPCSVGSAAAGSANVSFGTLKLGTHASLSNRIQALAGSSEAGVRVKCAPGVPYRISVGAGQNDAGAQLRMKGPSGEFIAYGLYSDAALATPWNAATPMTRIGTGIEEIHPVYAVVEPQKTPGAGLYRDTVMVTIQW